MIVDWLNIAFKAFWCGWAALGFGILFNVPYKTLYAIWIGGAISGLVKFAVLSLSANTPIIQASFFAALSVGLFSLPVAYSRHEPPMIFAIPSVIPLIPGVFAYKTMIGFIRLTGNVNADYSRILSETIHNGVTTLFTIMAIALGVTIPLNVIRSNAFRKLKI